jgi:photosystem II stability/assembly factor-like uncharacterized protein
MRRIALLFAVLFLAACGAPSVTSVWEAIPLGTRGDFSDLWFIDQNEGWIVGGGSGIHGGLIGHTEDGGRNWQFSSGVATAAQGKASDVIDSVRFMDPDYGFVAMDSGQILATDDGGDSWKTVIEAGRPVGMDFIDRRNGWLVGDGFVRRTEDSGVNWHDVPDENATHPLPGHKVRFQDEERGWLAGRDGRLLRTTDGGATWSPVETGLDPGERSQLNDITFANDFDGWVVGDKSTILHTADKGETWSRQSLKLPALHPAAHVEGTSSDEVPDFNLTSVRFLDPRQGFVVGHFPALSRSLILRTRDAGNTWTIEADIKGEVVRAIFALDPTHIWAIGSREKTGSQSIYRRMPDAS